MRVELDLKGQGRPSAERMGGRGGAIPQGIRTRNGGKTTWIQDESRHVSRVLEWWVWLELRVCVGGYRRGRVITQVRARA